MARRWSEFDDWMKSSRKSRAGFYGRLIGLGVIGLIVVYGLGVWSGFRFYQSVSSPSSLATKNGFIQQNQTNLNALNQMVGPGNTITNIYNSARNSIVTITAVTSGDSKGGPQVDVGTGFFIDTRGDIATNAHVVNGQQKVSITFANQTFDGRVIGADPLDDLAVVHINYHGAVVPLKLGTVKTLQPGNLVVAIGNPFQLTSSVSSGIVSGLNRSMPTQTGHIMNGLVQTDAALNPGNSGGPLFNAAGEVVGINTAIESPIEGSVGIGFAIPIDRLNQLLPQLLSGAFVQHAWLGIEGLDIDQLMQKELSLPVAKGIYVTVVTKGGPAQQAGLKGDSSVKIANLNNANSYQQVLKGDGDIVVAANGTAMGSVEDLTQFISQKRPGDMLTLTVFRNGKRMTVSVTLGNWPSPGK